MEVSRGRPRGDTVAWSYLLPPRFWLCAACAVSFRSSPACQWAPAGISALCCDLYELMSSLAGWQKVCSVSLLSSSSTVQVVCSFLPSANCSSPHFPFPQNSAAGDSRGQVASWQQESALTFPQFRSLRAVHQCCWLVPPFLLLLNLAKRVGGQGGEGWEGGRRKANCKQEKKGKSKPCLSTGAAWKHTLCWPAGGLWDLTGIRITVRACDTCAMNSLHWACNTQPKWVQQHLYCHDAGSAHGVLWTSEQKPWTIER